MAMVNHLFCHTYRSVNASNDSSSVELNRFPITGIRGRIGRATLATCSVRIAMDRIFLASDPFLLLITFFPFRIYPLVRVSLLGLFNMAGGVSAPAVCWLYTVCVLSHLYVVYTPSVCCLYIVHCLYVVYTLPVHYTFSYA